MHVYPDAAEIGRRLAPAPAPSSPRPRFRRGRSRAIAARISSARAESAAEAHAEYLAWSDKPTPQPGAVNLAEIVIWLREHLPADAILTNGAGNFAAWVNRFYRVRRFGGHLGPNSGSMGYGVPAAAAMQRLDPAGGWWR